MKFFREVTTDVYRYTVKRKHGKQHYKGLQKIRESSKVPVIASVETVVAALVGILLYHERLGVISSVGVLLVLFSILLMNKKENHIGDTTEGFTLH